MLTLSNMLHLLAHEFASLSCSRFPFGFILFLLVQEFFSLALLPPEMRMIRDTFRCTEPTLRIYDV